MVEVIDLAMAAGTKDVCLRRGYDPRELPLVVAGGAGAVHAGAIAEELGMSTRDRPAPLLRPLRARDAARRPPPRLHARVLAALGGTRRRRGARRASRRSSAEGMDALEARGRARPTRRSAVASADLRYVGQHHEVSVSFPLADLDDLARVEAAFHRRHEELYGFASPGKPMEVIGLHATVLGRRDAARAGGARRPAAGEAPRRAPRARCTCARRATLEEVEVLDGDRMAAGQGAAGPAARRHGDDDDRRAAGLRRRRSTRPAASC